MKEYIKSMILRTLARYMTCVLALTLLNGCFIFRPEPIEWTSTDHRRSMETCRRMCSGNVESYDPNTGECRCFKKSSDIEDERLK